MSYINEAELHQAGLYSIVLSPCDMHVHGQDLAFQVAVDDDSEDSD